MTEVEKAVWDQMLDAEMNALYYGYLSRRYATYEKTLLIFVAIVSTSAIATLQLWKANTGWFQWGWFWDFISILAVCASVASPFLNFGKVSRRAASLRPVFLDYKNKYEDLWFKRNSINSDNFREILKEIRDAELSHSSADSNLPRDTKLLEKCQDEIIKAKGLI